MIARNAWWYGSITASKSSAVLIWTSFGSVVDASVAPLGHRPRSISPAAFHAKRDYCFSSKAPASLRVLRLAESWVDGPSAAVKGSPPCRGHPGRIGELHVHHSR